MAPIAISVLILGFLSEFAGLYHLYMFIRRRNARVHLYFSLVCLSAFIYDILCAGLYNAKSFSEGWIWQSLQFPSFSIFIISMIWFICYYAKLKSKVLPIVISNIMMLFAILDFVFINSNLTLSLNHTDLLKVRIGQFIQADIYECIPGLLLDLHYGIAFVCLGIIFYILLKSYWSGQRQVKPLLASFIFFTFAAVNDTLLGQHWIKSIYLMEYFFFINILAMSYIMLNEFLGLYIKVEDLNKNLEVKVGERTAELKDANKKLEELDLLKNDFIANITHDFRSPLTVILNSADIGLKYDDLKEINQIKTRYQVIYDSSLKLKTTIDRLLDLAKIDAKGIKLNVRRLNLSLLLSDIFDYYKTALINTAIELTLSLPEHPVENIFTDADKLEEIISNVLSNAIKYVDAAEGKIRIELADQTDSVSIVISDNGIGIPPDKLESVFKRFEQLDSSNNAKYKGTGIGLAYCRKLIEIMKGEIYAESEGPNKGSRFVIRLKKGLSLFKSDEIQYDGVPQENDFRRTALDYTILQDIKEKTARKEVVLTIEGLNPENEFDIKKSLILLAEDNQHILEIELEYLRKNGFRNFIITYNGLQAVEAAFRNIPDIILCDFNMPLMRGDEFQNVLSGNPDLARVPFVFISALSNKTIINERRMQGASAFIQKPLVESEFLSTTEMLLKKHMDLKQAQYLATIDELTGLNNKRNLKKMLILLLSVRYLRHLSVIFFDLDHFKLLNDTYGHQAGDEILRKVGEIVKKTIRQSDFAGRYGGEEFIIVLPDTEKNKAMIVAEKIRSQIENMEVSFEKKSKVCTSSFGISSLMDNETAICEELNIHNLKAIYSAESVTPEGWKQLDSIKYKIADILINYADLALYKSKATVCKGCSHRSIDDADFRDHICPKCGCKDVIPGRNKIVEY